MECSSFDVSRIRFVSFLKELSEYVRKVEAEEIGPSLVADCLRYAIAYVTTNVGGIFPSTELQEELQGISEETADEGWDYSKVRRQRTPLSQTVC